MCTVAYLYTAAVRNTDEISVEKPEMKRSLVRRRHRQIAS
jgi:hypothetical protein